MDKKAKSRRTVLYIVFIILIIVVAGVFVYFISMFSNYNSTRYVVSKDSVLYTSSFSYTKVNGDAYLNQRLDGFYYLNDNYDNSMHITKIAKTAISCNDDENLVFIYGVAYEVEKNGEVTIVNGKTEVDSSSKTRFFKIDDRKYMFVDRNIKSNEGTINTSKYLIIDLDKEGNASFANNKINIKTIKPIIIKGTDFDFDIANENLIYNKNIIDLKKVLGSTNQYSDIKNNTGSNNDNKTGNNNSSDSSGQSVDTDYYDEYFNKIINSVNNLTSGVQGVNENTKKSVKKGEVYFDFNKWVVLKSLSASLNSVTINYQIFDSNNEYQVVYIDLSANNKFIRRVYLNKSDTKVIINDLNYESEYSVSLGHQLVGSTEYVVDDVVTFITESPKVKIAINRVTPSKIYFTVKTENFKLDSGDIYLYNNDSLIKQKNINVVMASSSNGYEDYFEKNELSGNIELRLGNCYYNNNKININKYSKIFN